MNAALTGLPALALYGFGLYQILTYRRDPTGRRPHAWVGLAALALHAASAWSSLVTDGGINLSFFPIASIVGLALAATAFGVSHRVDFPSLLAVTYTIAALSVAGSIVLPATAEPRLDLANGLVLHIVVSIAAYTALSMAAVHSVLTLALETRLRHHETVNPVIDFPPLESMVALLFRLVWIGLALLTVAIVSGFVFLEDLFAQHVVHHTVLATSSWLLYAVLLAGHLRFGWRGKTTIRWTLVAFALLALAYFGSKFVLEFVLEPR